MGESTCSIVLSGTISWGPGNMINGPVQADPLFGVDEVSFLSTNVELL
jgi:hypothetical protein